MKIDLDALNNPTPTIRVESVFPRTNKPFRLAIVGDQPYDETSSRPFSRSHFSALLSDLQEAVGLTVDDVFQGNVLNFFPKKDHFIIRGKKAYIDLANAQVRASIRSLHDDLARYEPHFILLLGETALRAFKPDSGALDDERGAPFRSTLDIPALATYPAGRIFQQYSYRPIVLKDIAKAVRLCNSGWQFPKYNITFLPTYAETIQFLLRCLDHKPYLSVDVETNSNMFMTCVGIAYNLSSAFVIPFLNNKRQPYFTFAEHKEVNRLLSQVLSTCPLVGHNAVHFDHMCLVQKHKILANFVDDTMFAHWELYTEFPKSLAFLSSIYTDNPYWKASLKDARSGKIPYWKEYEYCGIDCIVTMQCVHAMGKELKETKQHTHYKFNIKTSRAFQYMSLHGARLDTSKMNARIHELEMKAYELASRFEQESGKKLPDILKTGTELKAADKKLFSIRSPKKMQHWLYEELRLPPQTKLVKNEFGEVESRETTDYLSLLYLGRMFPELRAIHTAGVIRKLLKRISTLRSYKTRPDGYIGWTFNLVGTDTGRASGYKPLDGLGIQPQNVDRDDRDLFLPDSPEDSWCKADLEGADSWTVAAQLASLGHPQMLNDLLVGLKPAARLAIAELAHLPMDSDARLLLQHKHLLKTPEGKIVYSISKAVSHGTNYGMKKGTMHKNIFKQSDGDLYVEPRECETRQLLLVSFYGITTLHSCMESIMHSKGFLESASGMKRTFYGRKDNSMLRAMLSFLPQAHTGYTTNVVINRLFYSPDNLHQGRLLLRPINQVHDETDFLFRTELATNANSLFASICRVPLEVWGVGITIPFEANYGPSWGELPNEFVL